MLHVLDLMEPEETVGNLWHDAASRWGRAHSDKDREVTVEEMQRSAGALFRALGGSPGVEICAAPLATSDHRPDRIRRIGTPREQACQADFDGDRLRLPPVIGASPVIERWAGVRPRARSRAPMLGAHPGRDGTFIANGGFKIGFGMAPAVAGVMADLVLDGHDRIPEGFRVSDNLRG